MVGGEGSNQAPGPGQTGSDPPSDLPILPWLRLKHISCGSAHTVVIAETNQVFAFGKNHRNQLGCSQGPTGGRVFGGQAAVWLIFSQARGGA